MKPCSRFSSSWLTMITRLRRRRSTRIYLFQRVHIRTGRIYLYQRVHIRTGRIYLYQRVHIISSHAWIPEGEGGAHMDLSSLLQQTLMFRIYIDEKHWLLFRYLFNYFSSGKNTQLKEIEINSVLCSVLLQSCIIQRSLRSKQIRKFGI